MSAGDDPERAEALAGALAQVRARIDAAARAVGRDPAEVDLLAVTKTRPGSDVAHLIDLGLVAFGENREQEGAAKAVEVAELRPSAPVRWHVVGRLQRRKAPHLLRWAHRVDSVDSERLADALEAAGARASAQGERGSPLEVLVQVSLDGDPARGGVPVADVAALGARVDAAEHLLLRGVMAVAPQDADPDRAFAELATVAERLRADHPHASILSAGMSTDLERAIAHGSTCVRVGAALLGSR